jgi:tetratricopeptide (TPR) repeat protein
MRFLSLGILLLLAAHSTTRAVDAPSAPPPAETMATRQLREVVERERAIWERLRGRPDNENTRSRAQTDFRDVITAYENVIRANPEFAEAYAAYGLVLSRTGNREAAVKAFLRANKLDPRIAMVKNQLGNYHVEEGHYKEALPYYLSAIELAPEEPLYHYQLGALLHEFKQLFVADGLFKLEELEAKSHEAFRRAAELAPDNWGYVYRYAESFYDFADPDWDAALAVWRQLEERAEPGLGQQTVRLHIARVLVEADRTTEARPILDTITEPALADHKQTVIAAIDAEPEN